MGPRPGHLASPKQFGGHSDVWPVSPRDNCLGLVPMQCPLFSLASVDSKGG